MSVNAAIETSTPVGWALGLILSIVLAGLVVRGLAKRRVFNRANLALLYTMLALAVPLMNIGLVRQLFLSLHTVQREYLYEGTSTYRTAYNSLNDRWFPVVPTLDGLAWNRAERAIRLLRDAEVEQRQASARRFLEASLVEEGPGQATLREVDRERLREAIGELSLDDAGRIEATVGEPVLRTLGLWEAFATNRAEARARSAEARAFLSETLSARDEWALSLVPRVMERADYSARERLLEETARVGEERREAIEARAESLTKLAPRLMEAGSVLGEQDRGTLREELYKAEKARLESLSRAGVSEVRKHFVFRLSRDERRFMLTQDGLNGPNQNMKAYFDGLWQTPQEVASRDAMSFSERISTVMGALPWHLYLWPMFSWGLLISVIYLFLMCLAEWLRRKWVSRENLPFPLVEIADNVIRHDYALEVSGDALNPERRKTLFNNLALVGFLLGFVFLFFQGLGHYGFINTPALLRFDFSENIFNPAGGALRYFPETIFVISPIVLGITFLLSLEVSFSIWVSYLLYILVSAALQTVIANPTDSAWTGFGDGKLFPFPMEQMLGACLCFAGYHWWKLRGTAIKRRGQSLADPYLPPTLTRWGLILLPVVIFALFWDLGLRNIPLLLLFLLFIFVITLTMARVRAETGLPGQQAVYEFTKMPIIFGLTGMTGAKVYSVFMTVVFLPATLIFRTLPQQLENIELARRYRISFRSVAVAGLTAVFFALAAGSLSFLVYSYYLGGDFYGFRTLPPHDNAPSATGVATYPLWVGHFLGEPGLDDFTTPNLHRIGALLAGFGIVGVLLYFRQKFLRFPLHPIGYVLLLLSIHYSWSDPYERIPAESPLQSSVLWGSAFMAWLIKRLVLKYGGMHVYKQAKPLFIGLVVGSVAAVFLWNMADLALSLHAARDVVPGDFTRRFLETIPFTPAFY